MADRQTISLDAATSSDSVLLSNLLELYIHDLSATFPNVELGDDGRFGYPKLPLYWSERGNRFAFLIRVDGRIAGFVLAQRGSPAAEDPQVLDVAEFFVMRRYRRTNVGRRVAQILWNRIPGSWTVRVSEGNLGALAFWRSVIADFTKGTALESKRSGQPDRWHVFYFESPGSPSGDVESR